MRIDNSNVRYFNTLLRSGVAASALIAGGAIVAPPAALGQTAEVEQNPIDGTAEPIQPEGSGPDASGVIIVTARKREETLTEVPVSISAVDDAALNAAGINSVTDLFATMPGIENNADGSRIANKPSIRSVGSQENISVRQKVSSFIDGVPMIGAQGIGAFAGLQRVEVLRGPQSAAFGRSTFAGAINYVTKDPQDYLEARVRLGVATHDSYSASGLISGPIVDDHLRAMVVAEHKEYGGPDEWVTAGGEQLGFQKSDLFVAKLGIGATEKFQMEIMYMHQEIEDGDDPVQFANLDQLVAHPDNPSGACSALAPPNRSTANSCVILGEVDTDAVPLIFENDYDDPQNPLPNPGTRINRDRIQGQISTEFESGISIDLIGGWADESGETQLDRDTFDLSGMGTLHVGSSPESTERYGELRVSSPGDDRLTWLVGASIYDYDYSNTVFSNVTQGTIMGLFSEQATNIGAFFQLGYELTDALSFSAEGRYQTDKISALFPANVQRNAAQDITDESTTKSFLPRFSVSYEVNPDLNLYLQVAKGNNSAGFNTVLLDPVLNQTATDEGFDLAAFRTFEEETMWSYEAGVKGNLGNASFALGVYYLDQKGVVVPVTLDWTPDDGVLLPGTQASDYFQRTFLNAGDFGGYGIEFEGAWRPIDALALSGSVSLSDVDFGGNACSPIPTDYGVPVDQTEPFACASIEGARQPMVSRFTTSFSADFSQPLNDNLDAFVRADHSWRSKRFTEFTNTDWIRDYHIVNLRAGVRNDKWKAEVFVNNLFDDDTASGAVRYFDGRLPGMTFNTTFQRRRPRQFGINLSYDY